jgi:NAD(P)-dependent dehydrogenase (short-subunit alcohol dehydrogenase family)
MLSVDLGLEQRVVAVTGGSSGIGLATVECLVAEGASVATCARDGRRLQAAVSHLDPIRVLPVQADVLDVTAAVRFIEATVARFGRLDALVNNAGQGKAGRLDELDDADWRNELDGKVLGILNPTRAAIPHLERSDAARIVNISAVSAREPDPAMLAVSTARAAGSNLSRGLAAELVPRGILVNTVAVGVVATGRTQERHQRTAAHQPYADWAMEEAARRGVPLGRLGRPEEVAAAITFLASPVASYSTGATLTVAGGLGHSW